VESLVRLELALGGIVPERISEEYGDKALRYTHTLATSR
jgi:hypothetical protein